MAPSNEFIKTSILQNSTMHLHGHKEMCKSIAAMVPVPYLPPIPVLIYYYTKTTTLQDVAGPIFYILSHYIYKWVDLMEMFQYPCIKEYILLYLKDRVGWMA